MKWFVALALVLAACGTKKEKPPREHERDQLVHEEEPTATPPTRNKLGRAVGPSLRLARPTGPSKAAAVAMAAPSPKPLPEGATDYQAVAEIPADAIEIRANVDEVPVTFAFKQDAVFQGVPCKAGEDTMVYKEGKRAGAVLSQDFAFGDLALAAGTRVRFQPDGALSGIELPAPQEIQGVPVEAKVQAFVDAQGKLTQATLAAPLTRDGVTLQAGTPVRIAADGAVTPQ